MALVKDGINARALAKRASSFPTGVDAIVLEPLGADVPLELGAVLLAVVVVDLLTLREARVDNKGRGDAVGVGVVDEFLWQLLKVIGCCTAKCVLDLEFLRLPQREWVGLQ